MSLTSFMVGWLAVLDNSWLSLALIIEQTKMNVSSDKHLILKTCLLLATGGPPAHCTLYKRPNLVKEIGKFW